MHVANQINHIQSSCEECKIILVISFSGGVEVDIIWMGIILLLYFVGGTKLATLETGVVVTVPSFVKCRRWYSGGFKNYAVLLFCLTILVSFTCTNALGLWPHEIYISATCESSLWLYNHVHLWFLDIRKIVFRFLKLIHSGMHFVSFSYIFTSKR